MRALGLVGANEGYPRSCSGTGDGAAAVAVMALLDIQWSGARACGY